MDIPRTSHGPLEIKEEQSGDKQVDKSIKKL